MRVRIHSASEATAMRQASVGLVTWLSVLACALLFGGAPASAALQTTYLRQLSGFGELRAGSVAVDEASGDVFVADSARGTVTEFDALGVQLASWNGSNTPARSFGRAIAVTINETSGTVYVTDRSHGVVDAFNAEGEYLSQIDGSETPAKSLGAEGPQGAAVDQATGALYVPDPTDDFIDVFDASGRYLSRIAARTLDNTEGSEISLAVDDRTGELFVGESVADDSGLIYVDNTAGQPLAVWTGANAPHGFGGKVALALDEATGDLLVANSNSRQSNFYPPSFVDVFNAAGGYLSPQILSAEGGSFAAPGASSVAVDGTTGEIFVAEAEAGAVDIYSSAVLPDVLVGAPRYAGDSATLNGSVNPRGTEVKECHFEYGTEAGAYSSVTPCSQTPAQIGDGQGPVPVSAEATALQPDTRYHFRLVASDANGANGSEDSSFFTATAPIVEEESASNLGSAGATVTAQVDAATLTSSYRVEYGTSEAYGSSTPAVNAGNPEAAQSVQTQLSGLQPDTEYHYRFVATNALGTTFGADAMFHTLAAPSAANDRLPDGRQYELVTSSPEDRDVYPPTGASYLPTNEFVPSQRLAQAASDGNALTYIAEPAPGGSGSGGPDFGNQFLARRAPEGGWMSSDLTPAGADIYGGIYSGLSSDFSTGILASGTGLLSGVPSSLSTNCTTLYVRATSGGPYRALYGTTKEPGEPCLYPHLVGMSADGSHVAFEIQAALTPEATGGRAENLYESVDGQLQLINVLPNGQPAGSASFGSPESGFFSRVVSSDGTRLFWTDLSSGALYMREHAGEAGARTVLVSPGGEYLSASSDGSLVFFSREGSLFAFDTNSEEAHELVHDGEVQGLLGTSEDGSYVYLVAKAALHDAGGEPLRSDAGAAAVAGEYNLYLAHAGEISFIATLAEGDRQDWFDRNLLEDFVETEIPPSEATAEVSADGQGAVFTSTRRLGSYENQNAGEVYVYQAVTGELDCVSCNPSGASPTAHGGRLSLPTNNIHLPRWINDTASEVFFESAEPLVVQHSDGQGAVYEWERQGTDGCELRAGCIHLLSGDDGGGQAVFVEASASGEDVFFVSRAHLLPEDEGDSAVIYDARVGAQPLAESQCTGTGCQGAPPAPPIFATPASVTFNGVGNFAPAPASTTKKTVRCAKGKHVSRGRCVRAKVRSKRKPKRTRKRSRKASPRSKRGRKS
jgi:DNA-binding beta-propeller fold protein YncE